MNDKRDDEPAFKISRRKLLAGFAASASSAALVSAGVVPRRAFATSNCFSGNTGIGSIRVFQNVIPPANNTEGDSYAYWPCTDAASAQKALSTSTWSGNKWLYVWGNRFISTYNPKPNQVQSPPPQYNGYECRVQYSTQAKANAATQSLIRYWLGMSDYADPWVAAGGSASDFVNYTTLYASPGSYFTTQVTADGTTYQVMTDVPWLPSFTLANMHSGAPGIVVDYEMQDGRSTSDTTAFIQSLYADINGQGKQLFLWTDSLDGPSMVRTGLDDTNLPGLAQNYLDYLTVRLWSGETPVSTSYTNQITVLKGGSGGTDTVDYSKLVVIFEVANTAQCDACFVNSLLTGPASSNPQAVWFWADGDTLGGACGSDANDKISWVLFGEDSLGGNPCTACS